jgi:hypothetical protein
MPDPNMNHHSSAGDYINEDDDILYHKPVEEEKQKKKPRIVTATGITESFDGRYINIDEAKRDDLIRTLRDRVFRDLEAGKAGERHLEYCTYFASSELRRAIELFIIEWHDLQEKKLRDWK